MTCFLGEFFYSNCEPGHYCVYSVWSYVLAVDSTIFGFQENLFSKNKLVTVLHFPGCIIIDMNIKQPDHLVLTSRLVVKVKKTKLKKY